VVKSQIINSPLSKEKEVNPSKTSKIKLRGPFSFKSGHNKKVRKGGFPLESPFLFGRAPSPLIPPFQPNPKMF